MGFEIVCLAWFDSQVWVTVVKDWPSYITMLENMNTRDPDRLEIRRILVWGRE